MSEYVRKQALLEHIRREISIISRQIDGADKYTKKFREGGKRSLEHIEHEVKSGAFDADESEGTWKATAEVLGRENAQMNSEIQHLRAAIKKAISMWQNTCDFADPEDVIEKMIAYLNEALSGAREKEEPNHD